MLRNSLFLILLAISVLLSIAPAQAEATRLMIFGDSLVHGYGLPAKEAFPSQLAAALKADGEEVEVINAGNSGDTTASGLARIDWSLADKPQAIVIVLGGNDGLRGLAPETTRKNMTALIQRLKHRNIPILLTGMMAPRNLGPLYASKFDLIFPLLAQSENLLFYPFFLEGVAAKPNLNQPDGIHPNREGVAVIVRAILPQVKALLREVKATQ